ncbi:ribulose-bisphosphate carboxylase large subunit family protein [Oceanibium sediminis]|uniref:ribulose-bisphosphate carboxylase large subunit family protein n=1 Tax=Oceanibium sediminis TaxID=2026339 RepID=UPI0018E507CB|nr:ribulose-bisphosphate carboxylase large subunit family protein [Oceanibium sediminis]
MGERISAAYILRTTGDPGKVAAVIAGEQSSGTFVRLPGETDALHERSAARVETLEEITDSGAPALPGAHPDPASAAPRSFRMVLSWPFDTVGASIPNLVATVAGNLFELREVAGLRLVDITLPQAFLDAYPGPGFGIEGTRALSGVAEGPLIGTIIKPSVGLGPEETAELVQKLIDGGIDFIKDDELQADGPACPFDARVRAVMSVIDRHAERTGKRVMYAANLTGDLDEMRQRHDLLAELGGTCAMLSLNSVGLAGVAAFRRHSRLPIHAHRNGWGYLGRSPDNGWSYPAWSTLWRVIGVDHMHVNGLANKFWEPDDSVIASARALLTPISAAAPRIVMPVFSSGQTIRQAHGTWARLKSADLIFCAGGGIMAHPSGVAAGVRALREAWDAARAGVAIDAPTASPVLREAMETFK